MPMMLTKERITLKVEFNIALVSSQKSKTNSKLLHQMLMMQIKERITLRVAFNTVLALNLK